MPVNKRQAKLVFLFPRLAQVLILATNSVPARAAGTPFLGLAFRKERSSGLDLAHGILVKSHGWHRSNNSFKPRPLRGLVQALLIFTYTRPQSGPS